MADQREEVIQFIRLNGPILPVQLAKHLNTNILFSSAILSELVDNKKIKISYASIGGSPLYYFLGQESRLDDRLAANIGGREKQAYELIKNKKVIKEKEMQPWERVAIKSLRDFAVPINVIMSDSQEVFWKYHLTGEEEARLMISRMMEYDHSEDKKEEVAAINLQQNSHETLVKEEELMPEKQEVKPAEINVKIQDNALLYKEKVKPEEIVKEVVKVIREELFKDIKPKQVKEKVKQEKKLEGKFYERVLSMLKDNKVEIIKEEMIKKDREINFIVNIETNLGKLRYLIKAKNKPSINEADVSLAFSEGQLKKLPAILIVNGRINKKALDLASTKLQGQLTIKEI